MTDETYRPWGQLQWLMEKLPIEDWSLLGTLSTEDRCTAAFTELAPKISQKTFLKILDPQMSPIDEFEKRFRKNKKVLSEAGLDQEKEIDDVELMETSDVIERRFKTFFDSATDNIILDISSMPKRWFFPIMRNLLKDDQNPKTIVVCYSVAQKYGNDLSSDLEALKALPTFDNDLPIEDQEYDELIVGVGFAPLGLKELFGYDIDKVRYLFPFPPGPPNYSRNWDFLRNLEDEFEERSRNVNTRWHINTYGIPDAFEAMCRATENGERTSALAPFGPKTHSLAMCLFALSVEKAKKVLVPVYYTQPQRYFPDYSEGIASINGQPDVKAYCIRLNGRNLYEV